MKIGDYISQYRAKNKISQREFAARCGTSHSYIAMLECGKNSKNGKPIVPSLVMLDKIATAMGIGISELIDMCDDMPVSLAPETPLEKENPPVLSEDERMFQELMAEIEKIFRQMSREDQQLYFALLRRELGKT